MLSKSKKFLMVFISAVLSLQLLISSCLIASAKDVTQADANSISISLSNASSFLPDFSDQEIINDMVTALEESINPQNAVKWATKKFLSEVLHIKTADQQFNENVLGKLNDLMAGQTKLQESINKLSTQIECEELTKFLNEFQDIIDDSKATKIYNSLLLIDKKEKSGEYTPEEAAASRVQTLTKNRGLTTETMGSTDTDIDIYTEKLYKALTKKMKVVYSGGVISNDNIFEINYQYLRRKYHWENQAYEEWIDFQNQAFATFTIAVTIDRYSLLARKEKIDEYNNTLPSGSENERMFYDEIDSLLETLDKYVAEIKTLKDEREVVKNTTERYYWTPGHEIVFYITPNSQGVPQENKNAGVGNTNAFNNAKGLKRVNNLPTVKYSFWKPFLRYEGGNDLLINYDQLNTIYNDYDGKKSLYEIFFSKDEGHFDIPNEVNEKCTFVIDEQKSVKTGNSYPLTYNPYLFKADQVYCYGVNNSKISKGKLPSPDKIHLCYYHRASADPKTGKNCVGIGVKSVGPKNVVVNSPETVKEGTYCDYSDTVVWSKNMDDIQLPLSENTGDLISVSADDNIITEDKYSISDDKTLITLKKEFLLTLQDGTHTIVVESGDAINRFSFTVEAEATPSEPGNSTSDEATNSTKTDTGIPQTGDSTPWKIWIYLSAFSGLTLTIALKKRNKISR